MSLRCHECQVDFNDGVHCEGCGNDYDYTCAKLTEVGWRKLGIRRATWKCPNVCRKVISDTSPIVDTEAPVNEEAIVPPSDTVTLSAIMAKLVSMETQLKDIAEIKHDMKEVKTQIEDLKESCKFNSNDIEGLKTNMRSMESRICLLEQQPKEHTSNGENWTRLNNIEIKGVPVANNENLFDLVDKISSAIDYTVSKSQINYLSRVPTFGSKEKHIIVSFVNRYVKEEFAAHARAKKNLSTAHIGLANETRRIYVNDHLSPEQKKLLTKTKDTAKTKGFQFVWVKFAKIHVRKNDTSHLIIVQNLHDLNKLV